VAQALLPVLFGMSGTPGCPDAADLTSILRVPHMLALSLEGPVLHVGSFDTINH